MKTLNSADSQVEPVVVTKSTPSNNRLNRAFAGVAMAQALSTVGSLLSLVAVPLYLHWLGEERYGLLLTALVYGGYLMFADGGLSWASLLLISAAAGREDWDECRSITATSFTLAVCSVLLVVLVASVTFFWLGSSHAPSFFPASLEFRWVLMSIAASTCVTLLASPVYNIFLGLQESYISAFYQGIGRIAGVIASLATAAMGFSLGWIYGAYVTMAATAAVTSAIHCRSRHKEIFQLSLGWNSSQVRKQLRSGAKSFAMQIGYVFVGSSPIIAISRVAGTSAVPSFTIPLTLLSIPLSIVQSLNSVLQAAYGEALASGDREWMIRTVIQIQRSSFILFALLSSGFFALGRPFIELWVGRELIVTDTMLLAVIFLSFSLTRNSIFRFALSGINRHREAGASDLAFGLLSLLICGLIVQLYDSDAAGFGVFIAYVFTSAWILPRALSKLMQSEALQPTKSFSIYLIMPDERKTIRQMYRKSISRLYGLV